MTDPFERLRRAYRERLVLQVEALRTVREQLAQRGSNPAKRSVRRLAHRLRGSGGTLGFPEVSEVAGRLEDADDADLVPAVDELLDAVRRAIRSPSGRVGAGSTAALIVDHDPPVVSILRLSLAPYADEVLEARTLDEARKVLKERSVAVIVIDLGLPDGDARDLVSEIGGDPTLSRVPVIVLSDEVDSAVRQECLAIGATEIHEKPMDPVALAASVRSLLGYEGRAPRDGADDDTGLPGPGTLFQAALAARRTYARTGEPWAVGLLRVPPGDGAVRRVADTVRAQIEHGVSLVRWDDDTLGILAAHTTSDSLREQLEGMLPGCRTALHGLGVEGDLCAGVMQATGTHPNNVFRLTRRLVELAAMAGGDQIVASVVGDERRRERVLLAEDDVTMAEAITRVLDGELDLEVHHVPDGADAVALARDAAFDLFVLDIEMPGADGLSVLRYLRSIPRYRDVPVVMVTALDDDRQLVEGLESGANDYVTKPFSPAVLAARIRRLL